MVGALGVFGPTFLANPIDKLNRWAHSAPMTTTTYTTAARRQPMSRLFADLANAEAAADAYATLAELIRSTDMHQSKDILGEIARHELARLAELGEEMEADADDRRSIILDAGGTPEQYEAWATR